MLFRKMLRDLKLNKTQFLSIFLMAFLSLFIYAGIGGEWRGMENTMLDFYETTSFADIWVYGSDISDDDLDAVQELEEVTGADRRLTLEAVLDQKDDPILTIHIPDSYEISTNLIRSGVDFDQEEDGIWLDETFAEENSLEVGDTISFTSMGTTLEKEILGLILNPEYIYDSTSGEVLPNHHLYGFAYLSKKALPEEFSMFYTTLLLNVTEDADMDSMEDKIDDALDGHYSVYLPRENFPSHVMIADEVEQHRVMANIFPLVFLAIAMLTILTTMTRIVNSQRTQIGTLKSMGFKRGRIIWHYTSYGFFVSFLGTAAGAIIGPLTLPLLFFEPMQTQFVLDKWVARFDPSFLIVALGGALLCGIFTWLACRNQLKDTPAQTLRPKPPKTVKRSWFEKSRFWEGLGFNMQWNIRDIFRSKARSIMALVGVIGCMMLLICAFGIKDSFDDIIQWQYHGLNRYETKLTLEEDTPLEYAVSTAEEMDGELIQEGAIELKANGLKKTGELLVYEDLTLIHFTSPSREEITLPEDGIALSYKMADILGVKEGDEITWHVYGEEGWKTGTIDTIYRTPISQGITISRDYFEEVGYDFLPTSVITSEYITDNPEHVSSSFTAQALMDAFDTMVEAMYVMVYVLIIAACILAVVVLYNLGVLSFTERQRELATLKVLGFRSRKIRKLLITQTTLLTVIGILVGIPAGRWLLSFLIGTISESFDMMMIVTPLTLVISIGISFFISILVTVFFSKNVKKIDMVSSLKGVE